MFVWVPVGIIRRLTFLAFSSFNGFSIYFNFMFMSVWPTCKSVHHVCARYPRTPEEGARSPRTRIKDSCKPSCECFKLNPGPLNSQYS